MKAKTKAILFFHLLLFFKVKVHGVEQTKELMTWNSCLKKALEVHPKVKASELTYKAYLDQEISAQSGYYPQIKGQVSVVKSFNDLSTDKTSETTSGSFILTQNLFSGFLDVQRAKEAQTRSKMAFLDWEYAKKEVTLELKKTYVEWVNQYKLNDFANKTLARRKENLNIVKLRYSSGRENKGAVVLSEAYYQESLYDQKNSEKNLLNIQGKILSQFLFETINSEDFTEKVLFLPEKMIRQTEPLKNSELPDKVLKTVDYRKAVLSEELLSTLRFKAQSDFYPSLDLAGSWGYFDEQFPLNKQKWNVGLTLTI
ncbi:MAG: TolC family protein, partial [Bdellovibrionaceae bacterium]|nr:TolC family protein [Pseudobdellovibrionaceae bacterium]